MIFPKKSIFLIGFHPVLAVPKYQKNRSELSRVAKHKKVYTFCEYKEKIKKKILKTHPTMANGMPIESIFERVEKCFNTNDDLCLEF